MQPELSDGRGGSNLGTVAEGRTMQGSDWREENISAGILRVKMAWSLHVISSTHVKQQMGRN